MRTIVVIIILMVLFGISSQSVTHAQNRECREVYVRSEDGKFVGLYTDKTLTVPTANPFVAIDGKWELHTARIYNVKIEEVPCW